MSAANDPGRSIRNTYQRLAPLPFGRLLFSRMLGWVAPYTGTIKAQVLELDSGHARVRLKDRRRVRNHLKSVHAVALVNLAEVTTGLAFMYDLPPQTRGILTGLSIEYLKKARGTLTATCRCDVPHSNETQEADVVGEIRTEVGELVARATARWRIGPSP